MIVVKGGAGSGNYGHEGRPGQVGGSAPGKTVLRIKRTSDKELIEKTGYRVLDKINWQEVSGSLFSGSSVILTQDDKIITNSFYGQYHTQLYAAYVLSHKDDYDPDFIDKARDIIEHGWEEEPAFEQKVMKSTGMISLRWDNGGRLQVKGPETSQKDSWYGLVCQSTTKLLKFIQQSDDRDVFPFHEFKMITLHGYYGQVHFPGVNLHMYSRVIFAGGINMDTLSLVEKERRVIITKGGPGSGNFDHAGRPGQVGGSAHGNTFRLSKIGDPQVDMETEDRIQRFIAKHIDESIEYVRVIGNDGRLVAPDESGDAKGVDFNPTPSDYRKLKGGTSIHNHPNGEGWGPSSSDVQTAARWHLKQMITVGVGGDGKKRAYIMRRINADWVPGDFDLIVAMSYDKYLNKMKIKYKDSKLSDWDLNFQAWNEVHKMFCEEYGHEYEVVEL